jgi:hypothetical protein
MASLDLSPLALTPRYIAPSAWWEHVPVAHWLVSRLQPRSVVELGSHFGVSFFAFCEAAQAFSADTFVYAIDSWQGDEHAGHYGEDVYGRVQAEQQQQHRQHSRLIRSSFDEAAQHFASASIDLLHIDGLHTYTAVKHDLDTWLPKVRPGGTILFHDTNVREREFGVWQLWQELQSDGRFSTLELRNGHGLGLASLATPAPDWHRDFLQQAPALQSRGGLLDALAQLRPEGNWGEADWSPYADQARAARTEADRWRSDLQHLQAERDWLQSELREARAEIAGLRGSVSWSLTEPLRALRRLARGRAG